MGSTWSSRLRGERTLRRVVIFGNSGSGKSTLANEIASSERLAHLDLDTLAWKPTVPPERRSLLESRESIDAFIESEEGWVIEGCYSDLINMVLPRSTEIIYLDLPVDDCIANARRRPWERHKYESQEAQDANLPMLIDWIAKYPERNYTFSRSSHRALFAGYDGKKTMHTSNIRRY